MITKSYFQSYSAPMTPAGLINSFASLAVLLGMLVWLPRFPSSSLIDIAMILAEVSTGVMGFMIAAIAILLSMGDLKFINALRESGHFKNLLRGMRHATMCSLIALVIMIVCLLVPSHFLAMTLALGLSVLSAALGFIWQAGLRFSLITEYL